MENNKLISMTEFVLSHPATFDYEWQLSRILNYANFLSQPLKLGQFIPVDDDGNVLSEPVKPHTYASENADEYIAHYRLKIAAYNAASERILFEGFQYVNADGCHSLINDECQILFNRYNSKIEMFHNPKWNTIRFSGEIFTVENIIPLNITLTPTALKMIYGIQK